MLVLLALKAKKVMLVLLALKAKKAILVLLVLKAIPAKKVILEKTAPTTILKLKMITKTALIPSLLPMKVLAQSLLPS